jgi:subtilisin-like proprotein convertase family protein
MAFKDLLSRFSGFLSSSPVKTTFGKNAAYFTGIRPLLVLVFSIAVLIAGIAVGAQALRSPAKFLDTTVKDDESSAFSPIRAGKKRFVNIDVRVNTQGNIAKVIESNALAGGSGLADISKTAGDQTAAIEKGLARLKPSVPDAEASISPLTGGVEVLRSAKTLSEAAPGRSGYDIVRDFIRENRTLYGLKESQIAELNFIGESVTPETGLRMVRVEQMINGMPIFQSETKFILDRDGRIVRSVGTMIPRASASADALYNLRTAQEGIRSAMEPLGISVDTDKMEVSADKSDRSRSEIRVDDENIRGVVTSKLVYFPVAPGVLVPAWSQIIFSKDADWYVLTDAREGTLLWRKNIRSDASTHQARFRVYVQADGITPADNPAPNSPSTALTGGNTQFPEIAPTIVGMLTAQNITASPNGWIDDCPGGVCTANETQTLGNNTLICMDRAGTADVCDTDAASVLDGSGRPTGNPDANARNRDFLGAAPRDFQTNFLPPPQGGAAGAETGQTATGNGSSGTLAIDQFRRAAVSQLFYTTNWFHDQLFALGFNPAAGNFQNNNFLGGGLGSDRVLGDAQDSTSVDNANFSTPPDGVSGRMQMYRFTSPTIDRDGGLDAEIVIHELTHGVSNRLVGNGSGLAWDIGGGMGEGWSDFYALSLLNNTNADNPNSRYASGAYATYKLNGSQDNYVYGIRRFPYSTDNTVNPLTWADVDQSTANYSGGIPISPVGFENGGAAEVHNIGEVWALTLWEMRSRIIADPAGANGDVPTGNHTSLLLVTDALKLTPSNPTFLDARNALIDADCATNACANEQSIWDAFADRGLGFKAQSPLGYQFAWVSAHIGVVESFEQANLDVNTVTITDTIGNNSGFIDPNEPVRVFVNLKNGWRNAAKGVASATATLTSSTPGVSILAGTSIYPAIAPQGNATGDYFVIRAPAAAACGSSINLTVQIVSALGTVSRPISLRVGAPTGTGAPITYTRSAVGLAIPNNAPIGVSDTQTITDDFEIADLNFRVDSLLHQSTGDVTVGIKGPSGYGTDLISAIGGGVGGGGTGDNLTNTLIDDSAAGDLLLAPNASAPFTGSWKPIVNNASWAGFGFSADPVGQLSRFNGTSTLGTWRVRVSDQAQFTNATGTLNGWSLIVTPRTFTCTVFTPPTAAPVSISGRVVRADGNGISKAIVTLTDNTGTTRTALTNMFGYYRFDNVSAGQTYFINAAAKSYRFTPRVLTVSDDITDVDLMAQ